MREQVSEVYGDSYSEYEVKAEAEGRDPMPEREWNMLSNSFGWKQLNADAGFQESNGTEGL